MRALILGLIAGLVVLSPPVDAAGLDVTGAWKLNRDLTTAPAEGDRAQQPAGGRRGLGGGGAGRRGGFGGAGGVGGRAGLGGMGGGASPSEEELRKVEVVRRRLSDVPALLVISRDGDKVTVTDGFGRSYALKADGKKQERVTGDGEFKSKTRFDATRLIVEEDFGGPKVITTYTPLLDGGEVRRLEVRVRAEGLPGAGRDRVQGRGGPRESVRVYDADVR
jgi:hypothetical protein